MESRQAHWSPSAAFRDNANMTAYIGWLEDRTGLQFPDYQALHAWSVADPDAFWASIWDYYRIKADGTYDRVRSTDRMPGCLWFDGARMNFAEHMLRYGRLRPDDTAVVHASEARPMAEMSWQEISSRVRILATRLREHGVQPGDRVVAYMPNIVETLIAMLASTAIGAVWSSAAPEFGAQTVLDRFGQVDPVALFTVDSYRFGGRDFDRRDEVARIIEGLPNLKCVISIDYLGDPSAPSRFEGAITWEEALSGADPADRFRFERVGSDHPLWILFSSGTTGLPKAIVHSHVGITVELLKYNALHVDRKAGDRVFFYATTSWMVWNSLVSGMLLGAVPILYDGHPTSPPDLLWRLCDAAKATSFGASPTFVQQMQKAGVVPRQAFALDRLQSVVLSGSPATPDMFDWFYRTVKEDLWIASQSGGTEFCSGLVGGVPLLPVVGAHIQGKCLGMAVEAWDEAGRSLVGEPGELVVAAPSPSMPLRLWNDPDDARYRESYLAYFPGVWRHGDFITFEADGGSIISGRSDATLNRFGVRIGAAEIYNIMAEIPGIADSLVLCIETADGGFWMPLFVKLQTGHEPTGQLFDHVRTALRTRGSPRHVPDEIIPVPDLPYTLTGKKMEVPLRRLLTGRPAAEVMSSDIMMNPGIVGWYEDYAHHIAGSRKPL